MSAAASVLADLAALREAWPELRGVTLIGLDLRREQLDWSEARLDRTMLLGCLLPEGAADQLTALGVGVFPPLDDLPFEPYRAELYTYEELAAAGAPGTTVDAQIGAWFASSPVSVHDAMIRAVHDATVR